MGSKRKNIGLPPGSVVFTGSKKTEQIAIHQLTYSPNAIQEQAFNNHNKITFLPENEEEICWYDIRGLHDTQLIEAIGKNFQIHALALEDIVDVSQRPKLEEYQKGLFIIIRSLNFEELTQQVKTEQIAIYCRPNLVISFQENSSDLFVNIRERIKAEQGRIRQRGSDYLVYALMDLIVDQYYVLLEKFEDAIEQLEEELMKDTDASLRERIHGLKKELLLIRKSVAPLREVMSRFAKSEQAFIEQQSQFFIRDLQDHTVQVIEMIEGYRDMLNGLKDLYLTETSFRLNQVMQVLTIITTIFVPLSFLTGLYGMNFDHIPELHYRYGYFILLGVMFTIVVSLLSWFRYRRWL